MGTQLSNVQATPVDLSVIDQEQYTKDSLVQKTKNWRLFPVLFVAYCTKQ